MIRKPHSISCVGLVLGIGGRMINMKSFLGRQMLFKV